MTKRWTPLAAHLLAATPRSHRRRDPQVDAARALAVMVVGVVVLVAVWGWLR